MFEYKVKEIVLDQLQNPLLLLIDVDELQVLPVGIGIWEAQAIVLKMYCKNLPRPMTHDLLNNLCSNLGARVNRIIITDIRDNTFFAEVYLVRDGEEIVIDARPSDAIAMALTAGSPIYVSSKVSAYAVPVDEIETEEEMFDSDGDFDEEDPPLH